MEAPSKNIHEDIIRQCLHGDRKSYEQLYKLYSKAMFNVAFRILYNEDEAQDVLQESFISAFRNLENFKMDSTFGAWLKRIVVNNAINVLRKRKWDFEEIENHPELPESDTLFPEEDKMKVEIAKKAINQLPEGYRMVFSLYVMEGYDHKEIGEILGVSESTSKSQFNRSKKKLRQLIQEML